MHLTTATAILTQQALPTLALIGCESTRRRDPSSADIYSHVCAPHIDLMGILIFSRAPYVRDGFRLLIALVVHPCIQVSLISQRAAPSFSSSLPTHTPICQEYFLYEYRSYRNDRSPVNTPKRHRYFFNMTQNSLLMESLLVTMRRVLLGTFQDSTYSILAIVLTALEEALLRSTMVYRDKLFDSDDNATAMEVVVKRKIWACSIAMSMFTEFVVSLQGSSLVPCAFF